MTTDENNFSVFTNLTYGVVGIITGILHGWEGFLLALSLICLMAGSGIHHYTLGSKYAWADWSAMYIVFSVFAFTLLNEFDMFSNKIVLPVCGVALGLYLSVIHNRLKQKSLFNVKFSFLAVGLLYTATLLVSLFVLPFWAWTCGSILFAVAFYLRQRGEKTKHDTLHDTLHGSWHILTGLGLFFYLLY